jgi:hypothetical protein
MTGFALVICAILLMLVGVQAVPTLAFVRALRRPSPPLPADEDCPKAAVLLSVRGNDPFLSQCIEGLLQQDYPCYGVRIIVDHVEDPAWAVIDEVVRRHPGSPVHVTPLAERFGTCTLKANGLLQAIAGLEESCEVFAILDADVIPHRTWLRELVQPFRDPGVAATTGNHWYMPSQPTLASLVRYAWNAGAAVHLYWGRCTWGGSMAVRTRLFRETDLRQRWRQAVASDTALDAAVRQTHGKVAFVPALMSVNRESCTLRSFWRYVQRQLLNARLKGTDWPAIVLHASTTTLAQLAAAALLVVAGVRGRGVTAAIAGGGLAAYGLTLFLLLGLLEASVRKATQGRGEVTRWLTRGTLLKLLVAVPAAQIVYAAVLPTVSRLRQVTWRGVTYRIDGRGVRLVHYEPYRRKARPETAAHSL